MQIQLGEHIASSDGKDVGAIRYLIFDTDTLAATKVVVEKGFFLPADIEIPLADLRTAPDDSLHLDVTAHEAEHLPRFNEADYTPPAALPRGEPGVPLAGVLWPSQVGGPTQVTGYPYQSGMPVIVQDESANPDAVHEQAEEARRYAVISAGADVVAVDGAHVGSVRTATVDSGTGRLVRLTVNLDGLFTGEREILGEHVSSLDDAIVYLDVSHEWLADREAA